MEKRIVALLLAAMLLLSLISGCSGNTKSTAAPSTSAAEETAPSQPEPEAPTTEPAAPTAPSAEEPDSAAEPVAEAVVPGSVPVSLPISEELIEIDWFTGDIGYLWSMLDDINENITLHELD